MPELVFDEHGLPVWTNSALSADRSGQDPDPVSQAIAAVSAIGQPGGIALPQSLPEFSPGAQPYGSPPEPVPGNALLNPGGGFDHPSPDAVELAPVGQPENRGLNPFSLTQDSPASGPEPVPARVAREVASTGPAGAVSKDPEEQAAIAASLAGYDAATARNEAERQMVERRASAQEQYAQRTAESDAAYQRARDAARQTAELDTAKWMADMEAKAKEEPDPARWFHSKSSAGKALWLLSLAFGTKAAATAPGVQNIALVMAKEEMDRDMTSQRQRHAREMEVLRTRGELLTKKEAQRLADLRDDHTIRAGQLLSLEKAALERANAPGGADDQAAMAAAHSWLAQQRMALAATRAQRKFQADESRLSRGHSAWMQSERQKFEADQARIGREWQSTEKALDRLTDLAGKQASVSAAVSKAEAERRKDYITVDPRSSGVHLVLPKNAATGQRQTTAASLHKDQHKRLIEEVSQPTTKAIDQLRTIKRAYQDGSLLERIAGADPELTSALNEAAYQTAKLNDPRGIVTNADFANGMKTFLGFDMSSTLGRGMAEAKLKASGNDMVKFIDKRINQLEIRANQELRAIVDRDDLPAGAELKYTPPDLQVPEVRPETLAETRQRVSGVTPMYRVPSTVEELKEARKEGTLAPYRSEGLVEDAVGYRAGTPTSTVVEEAKTKFQKLEPDAINALAKDYTAAVDSDPRAKLEIEEAQTEAVKKARTREAAAFNALLFRDHSPEYTKKVLRDEGLGESAGDPAYVREVMDAVRALERGEKRN